MDYELKKIYTDAELKGMIEDIIGIETLHKMEVQSRNLTIRRVKKKLEPALGNLNKSWVSEEILFRKLKRMSSKTSQ